MKTKLAGLITLFVITANLSALATKERVAISEELVQAFKDAYPQAEKVDWNEYGDHYFVHFKDHQVISEIEYDHEGNFIGSQRYYTDESLLPQHLTWELHRRFRQKTIYGVTETNSDNGTFYYVKLQDAKEWITIRGTADGNLQIIEKLNKQ